MTNRAAILGVGVLVVVGSAACLGGDLDPAIAQRSEPLCTVGVGGTGECASYPQICESRFDEQEGWHEICVPDPAFCRPAFDDELGWHSVCDASGPVDVCVEREHFLLTFQSWFIGCETSPVTTYAETCDTEGTCYTLYSHCQDGYLFTDWFIVDRCG